MAGFETYRRPQSPPPTAGPYVTIQRRGIISLNRAAYLALGEPAAVALLYDAELRRIGLRHVSHREPDTYHLRTSSPAGPFIISATGFVKYFGIDTSVSRRWTAFLQDDILCVDLTSVPTPVTSNRARPGSPAT